MACPIVKQPIFNDDSIFLVNTDKFRPGDLDLFIESMEIISRHERKRMEERKRVREERRQRKLDMLAAAARNHLQLQATKVQEEYTQKKHLSPKVIITKLKGKFSLKTRKITFRKLTKDLFKQHKQELYVIDENGPRSQLIPQIVTTQRYQSVEETMDEPITHLEAKRLRSDSDETYYSDADSAETSPHNSIDHCPLPELRSVSDSEESGVFPVGDLSNSLYFKNLQLRPRSVAVSNSDDISQAVKRRCTQPNLSFADEIALAEERCERALAEIMGQKYEHLADSADDEKKRQGIVFEANSSEEKFLEQALRLLKL